MDKAEEQEEFAKLRKQMLDIVTKISDYIPAAGMEDIIQLHKVGEYVLVIEFIIDILEPEILEDLKNKKAAILEEILNVGMFLNVEDDFLKCIR